MPVSSTRPLPSSVPVVHETRPLSPLLTRSETILGRRPLMAPLEPSYAPPPARRPPPLSRYVGDGFVNEGYRNSPPHSGFRNPYDLSSHRFSRPPSPLPPQPHAQRPSHMYWQEDAPSFYTQGPPRHMRSPEYPYGPPPSAPRDWGPPNYGQPQRRYY